MAITVDGWKGLSMGIFTAVSILGAWLAVVMKERAKQVYVTSGVLFSAGVLLAGGFVHLLFDSNEQFEELSILNFQWAFAITGITVVLLECLELALERVIDNKMNHSEPKRETEVSGEDQNSKKDGGDDEERDDQEQDDYVDNEEHDHVHIIDAAKPLASILLTVALSIHSILEGIGIGATDNVSALQSEFVAVVFHKGFTAFALGNQLVSSGYWTDKSKRKYFYISIGTFIGVSLLGIGIGWAISYANSGLTAAIFVGITSGSFIFVSALEIIPGEARIIKGERLAILPVVVCFIAGYILMAMLALWA
mmetsp:Transcript_6400/g.9391  ORF Transcript_6400/g.9391 Transcript_6400/m.9391 type:complete len:309 (+) Transcript_6400:75-1001(+)|eukprot:scaffold10964_cov146-Skeletonema_marinoi.AAC.1